MPPISLMLKPSSSLCNLRCKYCFYHDVAANRELPSTGMMSTQTLQTVLERAFEFAAGKQVMLSFQGGEPLLRGKQFFKVYADLLKKLNTKGSAVFSSIQTNGTLIDEEWCDLFAQNDILVGLSLDGDRKANINRVDAQGRETFDSVLAAAKMLEAHGVRFNILSVLTRAVALDIENIYSFFKSEGFTHLQFIPCLKPLSGKVEDESFYLDGKSYRNYLFGIFPLYLKDFAGGNYISVRQLDNFVLRAQLRPAEQCGMNGHCTHQYVIEGNGDVYPCDFYCTDDYLLGNIRRDSFDMLERSEKAIKFITESLVVAERCKACPYYGLCAGGCKRERTDIDKCDAYKEFFKYALPHLKRMS